MSVRVGDHDGLAKKWLKVSGGEYASSLKCGFDASIPFLLNGHVLTGADRL